MTRKSNKGVSIVEILIALAVFIILLIPIVSSVITGMKTTTSAKELQYRNEYVRNLMENVKEVPLSVLDTPALAEKYFKDMGAKDVSVSKITDGYKVTGKTNIGTENTEYAFQIEIDGSAYATVNKLTNGVVEDLDQTKVALISAPLSNYDYSAYDTLLTKKIAQLQSSATPYDATNDIVKFNGDTCARTINISVRKSSTQYEVKCVLEYRDRSNYVKVSEVVSETYVPYCQKFDKVPNIYLMYNACVYNNKYAKDITIGGVQYPAECVKLDVEDGIGPVNVFVIATPSDTNYRTVAGTTRPNVTFMKGSVAKDIYVYHNFATLDDPSDSSDDKNAINAVYNNFSAEQYGSLNDAWDGRSMYDVRIRMQQGDSVDMSIDPILQGTRGGDEIE